MNEPILIKAFDGLIGEIPDVAGPAYSSERLSAAQKVRENLEGNKTAEEVCHMYHRLKKLNSHKTLNFRL
jgi:hypothetical protein